MAMSMHAASEAMREAVHETVKRHSIWYLLQGILMVIVGILALLFPLVASVAIVLILGWTLIASGILQGLGLIGAGRVPHFWLELISVVLSIVVGWLLLRNPGGGLLLMTILLIVYFMVEGFSKVILALTIRPFPGWGWVFASGVVGILLAAYLWSNMPVTAAWILGLLLGILLIAEGLALTNLAWRVRTS
jgi:uncharacterized membrane protein HdeD (DUF308 family)